MYKKYFLRFIIITAIIIFSTIVVYGYNQAPMLDEKVQKGEIAPVEQRLPENPLEIEPWNEIGKYGGTWNRFSTSQEWSFVRMCMYGSSLIRFEESALKLAPNLLTDWESNENKTSWTLYFREGVKWSDGHPFTADDFLFWWEEMAVNQEHSEVIPNWAKVAGEPMKLKKIDEYTVKATFSGPNLYFSRGLAMWTNSGIGPYIVAPKHYLKEFHPDYNSEYDNFQIFEEKQEWWRNMECPVLTAWKPIEQKAGDHITLERNPYYYAVDPQGNQLPYLDKIRVDYVSDQQVYQMKVMEDASMQLRPYFSIRDLSLLKRRAEENNFKVHLWNSGVGSGPQFMLNQNLPDPKKREFYTDPEFKRALSHAINREKIQRMVFYEEGYLSTGHLSANTPYYRRSKEGREMLEKRKNLALEFNPEKSKNILNKIGLKDQDNDGWREFPDGEDFQLRVDYNSAMPEMYIDTVELVKNDWQNIGLKVIINPMEGAALNSMITNAEQDIQMWNAAGVPNMVLYPHFLVPVNNSRWAPLYGGWYQVKGTEMEGTELDKKPRERHPPRKSPEGTPIAEMQELLDKAKKATSWEESDKYITEIQKIHLEQGPFLIGTVAGYPIPVVVRNNFKNVPEGHQLALHGWVNPWNTPCPAITNPCQYYLDK